MDEVTKNLQIGAELALPDELPAKADLSHLPAHVLRSNAIETLLQQNEELMSRLSVNLRRITHLENIIEDQDIKVKKFKHHYDILKDEVYILNEKSSTSKQELENKASEYNETLAKFKAIDFEYTQLFQQNKKQKSEFINSVKQLEQRLNTHIKYKQKVKPLINDLRNKNSHLDHLQIEYSGQNKVLKDKLSAVTTYLQKQADEFLNEKNSLLKQFDYDSSRISELEDQNSSLNDKLATINKEIIKLRNENIKILRDANDQNKSNINNLSDREKQILDYKAQIKKMKFENIELTNSSVELNTSSDSIKKEFAEMKEQLENTQMFFASLQKQFEKEQSKTSSLQKINRRLSQEMNSYRSTIQSLKNIRDEKQIKSQPKNETINKIEDLIFEIERDFR